MTLAEKLQSIQTLFLDTAPIINAPLREHLQVPSQLVRQYKEIPIYPIHSHEMKMTETLLQSYKQWLPSIRYNTSPN